MPKFRKTCLWKWGNTSKSCLSKWGNASKSCLSKQGNTSTFCFWKSGNIQIVSLKTRQYPHCVFENEAISRLSLWNQATHIDIGFVNKATHPKQWSGCVAWISRTQCGCNASFWETGFVCIASFWDTEKGIPKVWHFLGWKHTKIKCWPTY